MAILDKAGAEMYADLAPGLDEIEGGRFAIDGVEALFSKYGAR